MGQLFSNIYHILMIHHIKVKGDTVKASPFALINPTVRKID